MKNWRTSTKTNDKHLITELDVKPEVWTILKNFAKQLRRMNKDLPADLPVSGMTVVYKRYQVTSVTSDPNNFTVEEYDN